MKHLENLNEEELNAVRKFQEYNASVTISYGSKANWAELVHNQSLYDDSVLKAKVVSLRSKHNANSQLEDEDGVTTPSIEFSVYNGMNQKVDFTTQETLLFVRAARKVRTAMETLVANQTAITKLEAEIAKMRKKTTTPEQALAEMQAQLDKLTGKVVTPEETKNE